MTWSARRKALVFSILLILVSSALLVTAAASTQRAVEPFRANREYPHERSVTKHGIALAIMVGYVGADGNRTPAVGADVSIHRHPTCDSPRSELVQTKTTGERGTAVFQLRRGCYHAEVSFRNFTARSRPPVGLREDARVGVLFAPDGTATWGRVDHRDMERRGDDAFHMGVRVSFNRSGERAPAAGANVTVHRVQDGRQELVHRAATDGEGLVVFTVQRGQYVVGVEWQGEAGRQRVLVDEDTRVLFYFDGEHVRSGQRGR